MVGIGDRYKGDGKADREICSPKDGYIHIKNKHSYA